MFRRETLSLSLRPVLVLSKIFSSFLASFLPAKIPYLSIKKNDNKKRDGKKRNSKKRKERKENVYFVVRNIRVSFFFLLCKWKDDYKDCDGEAGKRGTFN